MKANKGKGNMVASKTPGLAADVPGVQVLKQAKSKAGSVGFKKGGAIKGKKKGGEVAAEAAPAAVAKKVGGGVAEGAPPAPRLDKTPRKASGGAVNQRGRSPFTSASNVTAAKS
jgi:hypothetical protein